MQCYTALTPPTAVTHAVSLPFLTASATNLVVAKTSLLQIFSVNTLPAEHTASAADTADSAASAASASATVTKLVLVAECALSGTITSLARIKLLSTISGGEALLLSFRDAKLSLVEWDPEKQRIATISIHYYEGENVLLQPFGPQLGQCESYLTVDPSSRCAALKFGPRHLAILPFRQVGDELVEDQDGGLELDTPPPSAGAVTRKTSSDGKIAGVDGVEKETPYRASFVLPLTALDPALTHPVHLAFLHEYREPTFGVLFADRSTSVAVPEERKDILTYSVFTLDLEQRASTTLLSVQQLPSDLWNVIPLPLPVGGALLVGENELVHVDQAGKTSATAVNEFAKQMSAFAMADQSNLDLMLEDCEVGVLDEHSGDMLLILNDGRAAVLSFKLLGRTVSGLSLSMVPPESGGLLIEAGASCTTPLHANAMFIGSEDGDAVVLGWTKQTGMPQLSRKRSHTQMLDSGDAGADVEDLDDDDDEDDIYATSAVTPKAEKSFSFLGEGGATYAFRVEDVLMSLGPINQLCFGKAQGGGLEKLDMVMATGRGRASRLAVMNREIAPTRVRSTMFEGAKNIWSVNARARKAAAGQEAETSHDNLMFVFTGSATTPYTIESPPQISNGTLQPSEAGYQELIGTDFEAAGPTIAIGTLAGGTRVVQVRPSEVRTYEHDLGLSGIVPIDDEDLDANPALQNIHASFADPYLMVLRSDSSVHVMNVDQSGDLEPPDPPEQFVQTRWLSGCLYAGALTGGLTTLWLLGAEGELSVYLLPAMEKPIYTAPFLAHLPPVLYGDTGQRRVGAKETLAELLVADVGDAGHKAPLLIVRSATDDVALYHPFRYTGDKADTGFAAGLRFRKVPHTYIPKWNEDAPEASDTARPSPMQALPNLAGYSAVFLPGASPSLVLREARSMPRIIGLRRSAVSPMRSLAPLHREGCEAGFAQLGGDGEVVECRLPDGFRYGETGWAVRKWTPFEPRVEIRHLAYHAERDMYIVATSVMVGFEMPEDETRGDGAVEEISLRPQVPQYTLHILSASTHHILHSFPMPPAEIITCITIAPLEISEHTHERKPLIVIGTAQQRGEDLPSKGALYIFAIIDVVPAPGRPDTGVRLHVYAHETVKGVVTACAAFPEGLVGHAQGAKLVVRGLKEDRSCLPVAFLDCQTLVAPLRTLANSPLWLAGDACQGLWLGCFTEEPYRLTLLGKGAPRIPLLAAEFLPHADALCAAVCDARGDLHVLQYDPAHALSREGMRLLPRASFHTGACATGLYRLPSSLAPSARQAAAAGMGGDAETKRAPQPPLSHVLATSAQGALALLTPLDEPMYRRLAALQTLLAATLEHPAGLNPRAYRAVDGGGGAQADAAQGLGARGVVDGSLVLRIGELGAARRNEVLARVGGDVWQMRSDGEGVGGGGLGYL